MERSEDSDYEVITITFIQYSLVERDSLAIPANAVVESEPAQPESRLFVFECVARLRRQPQQFLPEQRQ